MGLQQARGRKWRHEDGQFLEKFDGKEGKGVLAGKGCRGTSWVRLRPVWRFLERGEEMQRREEEDETSSINTCGGPRRRGRALPRGVVVESRNRGGSMVALRPVLSFARL